MVDATVDPDAEARKRVVLDYVDAFNRGDLDAVCALFADDAQVWGVLGAGSLEVARPIWSELIDGLQMQLRIEGLVCEGEIVAARYLESGTSAKPFRGLGPTGRDYKVVAMEWFVIRDGRIRQRWGARDFAAISRQLGFPPA